MLRTWPVRLPAMEFTLSVRSFQVPATPGTTAWPPRLALGADLAGDACDLGCEAIELVHHGVDGVLKLKDFTLHVYGDLAGEIPARDGGRDFCDVAHLTRKVRRHRVDGIGEILPGPGHTRHNRLAAKLAFGADFTGDAGHFGGEGSQLIHHRVDGFL